MDKRETDGRFATGNGGGPGRPRRQTEFAFLRTMLEEISLDTWRQIVRAAVKRAKGGDARALAWLSGYVIGLPKADAIRPSRIDDAESAADESAMLASVARGTWSPTK